MIPGAFLGLVFWALAVISPLPYVRWNETCLALMPFDVLLLLLPPDKRRLYARGRVVMLGLVAALLVVGPPEGADLAAAPVGADPERGGRVLAGPRQVRLIT